MPGILNPDLIELLSSIFVRHDRAATTWGRVISQYLALPALRGFWPMSSANEGGNALDLSGQGRTLTYTGNPTYNFTGLAPYIDLDGVGDYLTRADEAGLDVLGNEAYVGAPGLTVGGWFRFDRENAQEGLICKSDGTAANRNWDLLFRGDAAGDPAQFAVSNGANSYTATGTTDLTTATWYFIVGRYVPSTSVDLWVDAAKSSTVAGIPATANNSNAAFQIGARNGLITLDGRASLCFLCAAALSDSIITALYQHSRVLFGV